MYLRQYIEKHISSQHPWVLQMAFWGAAAGNHLHCCKVHSKLCGDNQFNFKITVVGTVQNLILHTCGSLKQSNVTVHVICSLSVICVQHNISPQAWPTLYHKLLVSWQLHTSVKVRYYFKLCTLENKIENWC